MATQSKNISQTMEITKNELDKIENALEKAEFRQLLCDYAKEVNQPENRASYEADIIKLEEERGYHCTFLHPKPGYVLKTTNLRTDEKVFINVCSDDTVNPPTHSFNNVAALATGLASKLEPGGGVEPGVHWAIPYFLSSPRKDCDRGGRPCTVYDVIFHSQALALAKPRLRQLVIETALEGVEKAFHVKLEHSNLKFPKMKFKGSFHPTVIRKPLNTVGKDNNVSDSDEDQGVVTNEDFQRNPTYVLKYRHNVKDLPLEKNRVNSMQVDNPCRPSEIVVSIDLPEFKSSEGVDLDITDSKLTLETVEPVAYNLSIPFSYPVVEERATAKFDKNSRTLTVTAPVRPEKEVKRLVSTDSGIEVDAICFEDQVQQQDKPSSPPTQATKDLLLPAYTCNIYEDLMIFTLSVKNVDEKSLVKASLEQETFGFSLLFSSIGSGFVKFDYGFFCALALDTDKSAIFSKDPANCVEVEVWNSNIIVKVSLPPGLEYDQYKVGSNPSDLTLHSLPRLRALRERMEKMKKKGDGNNSQDNVDEDMKERHSSGDSQDSLFSEPVHFENHQPSLEGEVKLKSILKQRKQRCYSESHKDDFSWRSSDCSVNDPIIEVDESSENSSVVSDKSVRFSEVVQRKVFRPNSSIFPQTKKNWKKKQAKLRRAERRASEGDVEDEVDDDDLDLSDATGSADTKQATKDKKKFVHHEHEDSGVASSVDECEQQQRQADKSKASKSKKKRGGRKSANKQLMEATNDLIFDLDI